MTIQVKSSRTWPGKKDTDFQFNSWLNYFDIKDNYSDFYFIYMTYPVLDTDFRPDARWQRKILVFSQKEMVKILDNVKTKAGKRERFFSFGFNGSDSKIYGVRGFTYFKNKEFSKNFLENKIFELRNML